MEFIPLALLAVLFWLFVIRPQRRRAADQAELLATLRPGNEVLTAGGLYGTVRRVEEDAVVLEVAPGTELRFDKRAIAGRVAADDASLPPGGG